MGLLFEKRKQESSKPFKVINYIMIAILLLLLFITILNDFNSIYVGTLFIFLGGSFFIDAIENFLNKEQKKFIINLGLAIILFVSTSSFLLN
ncbi:hypothetical protein ACQCWA_11850 [Rossellomorea aquimaris]|nr:hypothetical protein [Bacillus sp. CH30_1T]KAA0560438.1 hypothetical protein F0342_22775 [Bacillus sp. CH30_1T]